MSSDSANLFSRRRFAKVIAAIPLALAALGGLGCVSRDESAEEVDPAGEGGAVLCDDSELDAVLPTPFVEVLGSRLSVAQAAAAEKAPDAKLLALRMSTDARADVPCAWSYLFCSLEKESTYTVFVEGDRGFPAYYGSYAATQEEWDALPLPEDIAVGPGEALEAALPIAAESPSFDDVESYYLFLLMGIESSVPTELKPMAWYVELNVPTDDELALAAASGAAGKGRPEAEIAVDARSGEVSVVDPS